MQLAGQPVLPEIQTCKQKTLFGAKTFIRHGLVLVTQEGAHLGGVGRK